MSSFHNLSLCFDLDGTLVDTALDLVRVLNIVLAEEGLPQTDYTLARAEVGFGSRRLITSALKRAYTALPETRIDTLQKLFLELYAADIAQCSIVFPGVMDTLCALKKSGASLSVCTNKPGYLARPLLDILGMTPLFDRIVGGDDVLHNKPAAAHIYAAAGHKGRSPIIMVGDSYPDVAAARAAKVPVIIMEYGYSPVPPIKLKADRMLRQFRNIPSALKTLGF